MHVWTSRWLLPVSSSPIRDGAVAVHDGTIQAIGPLAEVLQAAGAGEAEVRELGDVVVLPGLINAHTHLELSWMRDDPPPAGEYMAWLRGVIERTERADEQVARAAAVRAIETIVSRGTVAVGDVANQTWVAQLLALSGLHGIAFHEILGFPAAEAERLIEDAVWRLEAVAADPAVQAAGERLRVVPTPHGPHTTSSRLLRALAGRAAAAHHPLSIHAAESAAEVELIASGTGPMVELLRERGRWDASFRPAGFTPIEYLSRLGVLTPSTLVVHCVHLDQRDHRRLQAQRSTVVACPRSNSQLGVGTAPISQLLREGIPVALGTDSLASAPDLDMFSEMVAVRRRHTGIAPAAVLRMATVNGATALGLDDRLGTIERGKLAQLIAVPLVSPQDDPLETVCAYPRTVQLLGESGRPAPVA